MLPQILSSPNILAMPDVAHSLPNEHRPLIHGTDDLLAQADSRDFLSVYHYHRLFLLGKHIVSVGVFHLQRLVSGLGH